MIMGIAVFKFSFEDVYCLICGRKFNFMAPLASHRKM